MNKVDSVDFRCEEIISGKVFRNRPFRALLKIFKGNIHKLLISYIFFALKHAATWVMPIIIANVVDIATKPSAHSLNELWINLAVGLFVVVENIPTSVLYNKYLSTALRNVEAELRSSMVRKLQMLSISFYKRFESGRIQSKIIRDVESIITLARRISNGVVPIIINLTVVIVITSLKNPTVTVFFLASIPISLVVVRGFRKNIRVSNSNFRHEIENMSSKVTEMIEMVPVTKAQALEHVEISRIDRQLQKIRKTGYHLDIITAFFGASAWLSMQIMQLVCLGFSGCLAYKGYITVGEIVLYQTYFTQILNQVNSLVNVYPDIMKGFESIRSVGEIFLADDVEDFRGKEKLKHIEGKFSFQHVSVRYSPAAPPSLYDFNLTVKAGEKIAIVGESGAGKTTILNLILGFIKPSSGAVYLDNKDLSEINLDSFRSRIAFVPQNVVLFPGTIRENITYGMDSVSEEKLKETIGLANLTEVIKSLPNGLDTVIGEHGDTLSGGQKQRITIARAIIRDPKIIILDEATSALDSESEKRVQKALDTLTEGHTTFMVAHRLNTVRNADRIVVLKEGKCVESGSYSQLMAQKGAFYTMNQIQHE
jgi:ATP-binding cassette subfamily B protein